MRFGVNRATKLLVKTCVRTCLNHNARAPAIMTSVRDGTPAIGNRCANLSISFNCKGRKNNFDLKSIRRFSVLRYMRRRCANTKGHVCSRSNGSSGNAMQTGRANGVDAKMSGRSLCELVDYRLGTGVFLIQNLM